MNNAYPRCFSIWGKVQLCFDFHWITDKTYENTCPPYNMKFKIKLIKKNKKERNENIA
jgi:hypothetical protein